VGFTLQVGGEGVTQSIHTLCEWEAGLLGAGGSDSGRWALAEVDSSRWALATALVTAPRGRIMRKVGE